MSDIVERLRICAGGPGDAHTVVVCRLTRDTARDAAAEIERLRAEIAMLRADLLKTEMKAELDDLENVGRLVAIGRREGIEAAMAAAHNAIHDAIEEISECSRVKAAATAAIRALLGDGR